MEEIKTRMKTHFVLIFLILVLSFAVFGQDEYAPIQKKKIKYKDWTYKNVVTNEDINLRGFSKDKKLVMVFYFATFCHNSNHQMPVVQKLYKKYKDKGFAVIGISSYSSLERAKKMVVDKKITFPVVGESFSRLDRKKTLHYNYRKKTGDKRKWGTPYNLFLIHDKLNKTGDILTKKTNIVSGEITEKEAEEFIKKHLKLAK